MAVMLTSVLMWLGRRIAAQAICFSELWDRSQISYFYYFPTTITTGRHLGFECDYNYHTAFRACYVIMHKVYLGRNGYEIADSHDESPSARVGYNYLISDKREWSNCFIKNTQKNISKSTANIWLKDADRRNSYTTSCKPIKSQGMQYAMERI